MIQRVLERRLRALAKKFPVVTVTGPRQSGKTTLCQAVFPDLPYVSLEAPDVRAFATQDPRGLLATYPDGAVLDEVQRTPELLSYIQTEVDSRRQMGRYVLTGSANFTLLGSLSQSLAGRTALLTLLPLGWEELRGLPSAPTDLFEVLYRGSYPATFDRDLRPGDWYAGYVTTYLERDVRAILDVGDLLSFQTFLRLSAGRTSQLVNFSALGADAGITHNTAKAWLGALETGYLVWRLAPFFANLGSRLVKTPKLHFLDTGLICYLLGIHSPAQLRNHPLRGPIFETWVVSEILKARLHRGLAPASFFFRDSKGSEVDLVLELAQSFVAIETKSGQTLAEDFFKTLRTFEQAALQAPVPRPARSYVIYGGTELQHRSHAKALPWALIDREAWWDEAEVG